MSAREFIRAFHRLIGPIEQQVAMSVSRFIVDSVSDGFKFQGLKLVAYEGETLDDVEHLQPGGLTHVALGGAEGLLLCVGGNRDHPVAVGVSNRAERPKGLQPGETVLYTVGTNGGTRILLKANGDVEITPKTGGKVRVVGDFEATGEITAKVDTTSVTLTQHVHPNATGPTGAPTPGT